MEKNTRKSRSGSMNLSRSVGSRGDSRGRRRALETKTPRSRKSNGEEEDAADREVGAKKSEKSQQEDTFGVSFVVKKHRPFESEQREITNLQFSSFLF